MEKRDWGRKEQGPRDNGPCDSVKVAPTDQFPERKDLCAQTKNIKERQAQVAMRSAKNQTSLCGKELEGIETV